MLRNPLRPGGQRKTNPANVRISTKAAGRMPASMWCVRITRCEPQDAASIQESERGYRHFGAQARAFPASREPGTEARLHLVHRATHEAAGCGRRPRHPAARRAAKNKPDPHPERNQGSRQDAGVDGVSRFTGRAAGRGVDAQVDRGHGAIRAKA